MITSSVDSMPPGNWAEWFGAGAAALAFGATSVAIWSAHRLRLREHSESMYDQALAVTVEVGQGTEYVDSGTSEQPERDAVTKVNVTVFNGGRRPISNVAIVVATMKGAELGENGDDFIQAKGSRLYQFDPIEDVYAPFGSNPTVRVTVRLEFEDITGMLWRRGPPSDELLMFPKERWWGRRRTGLRHQTRARRPG